MHPFEGAEREFAAFLRAQRYPPNLLWLPERDVLYWGRQFYFRTGDSADHARHASAEYHGAMSRHVGVKFHAVFKTERWSICRLIIPEDELDAERRVIPQSGIAYSATVDPKPATAVEGRLQWRILKWLARNAQPVWF